MLEYPFSYDCDEGENVIDFYTWLKAHILKKQTHFVEALLGNSSENGIDGSTLEWFISDYSDDVYEEEHDFNE